MSLPERHVVAGHNQFGETRCFGHRYHVELAPGMVRLFQVTLWVLAAFDLKPAFDCLVSHFQISHGFIGERVFSDGLIGCAHVPSLRHDMEVPEVIQFIRVLVQVSERYGTFVQSPDQFYSSQSVSVPAAHHDLGEVFPTNLAHRYHKAVDGFGEMLRTQEGQVCGLLNVREPFKKLDVPSFEVTPLLLETEE